MPKPKPDQVIRYEVVLGSVERQALKDIRTAYAFGKVATPITTILDDAGLWTKEGIAILLFALSVIFDVDIPFFPDMTDIEGIKQDYENYKLENEGLPPETDRTEPTNFGSVIFNLRNPNWNLSDFSFDALTGGLFKKF